MTTRLGLRSLLAVAMAPGVVPNRRAIVSRLSPGYTTYVRAGEACADFNCGAANAVAGARSAMTRATAAIRAARKCQPPVAAPPAACHRSHSQQQHQPQEQQTSG